MLANANDQPNTRTNEEQLTYTINSELQVIEKKMETYKEMIALESKKAKVLEKIRAEVLNGNNIIGKRDGEVETTWTLEELAQQVLYESANMNYYRRGGRHLYEAAVISRKNPKDMFYEVFVKRNELAIYDDTKITDIDVLAIPFKGGYSGSRRGKRGSKLVIGKTTPNINLIVMTDSNSKLTFYDGETGDHVLTLQTKHGVNKINQTLCNFNIYDAYCVTIGIDGDIYVHALTVYLDQRYLSGKRIVLSKMKKMEAAVAEKEKADEENEENEEKVTETTEENEERAEEESYYPPKEGLWVKVFDEDVLIQTNETFSTADEQIDYVFEHASMGRTRLFLIGNSVGQVGIFWRNGSSYYNRKFEINAKKKTPIHAISASRSFTAVSKGKSIAFLNLGRQTVLKHECHAGLSEITSIVYDHIHSQIMYAASVDGEIFVFNARTRSKNSGLMCKLLYKLNSNTTYASTLYQRKGFLIATSNNEMNVYNTSNVLKQMPYLTSTHAFKNAIPRMSIPSSSSSVNNNGGSGWFGSHSSAESTGKAKDHEILSSFSILPDNKIPGETVFAILMKNTKCDDDNNNNNNNKGKKEVCGTNNIISLYTSLLKYEPPSYHNDDITWLRTPLMALGVIGVFLYQFMGKRRGGGGGGGFPDFGGRGFPGGRGGSALNSNEMGDLRNIINRYQSKNGGSSGGNADAFMRSMERSSGFNRGRGGRGMMGGM